MTQTDNRFYRQRATSLNLFDQDLTKDNISIVVNEMVETVLDRGNPLEAAEKVKVMEEIIAGFKADKRYKDYALEELSKWGKDGYTSPRGVKITQMEAGGGQYDFSVCNDPVVIELQSKLKARQEFLKKLPPEGLVVTDQTTGETTTIYPARKPLSTTTYKISFPK